MRTLILGERRTTNKTMLLERVYGTHPTVFVFTTVRRFTSLKKAESAFCEGLTEKSAKKYKADITESLNRITEEQNKSCLLFMRSNQGDIVALVKTIMFFSKKISIKTSEHIERAGSILLPAFAVYAIINLSK